MLSQVPPYMMHHASMPRSDLQDTAVLVPNATNCSLTCSCFQCKLVFCGVCRSPPHPFESCFDDNRRVVRMTKRRPPLPFELAEMAAAKAEEIQQRDQLAAEAALSLSQRSSEFEAVKAHFRAIHLKEVQLGLSLVFSQVALSDVHLAQAVEQNFLSMLGRSGGMMLPAFHGTNPRNYPSIFRRGFLIPGCGAGIDVTMAHGAAHGRGIYTSNVGAAWLSRGFCSENSMLVCAVLDLGGVTVKRVHDAMVVFEPACVVPMFLATGTWHSQEQATPFASVRPVQAPVTAAVPTKQAENLEPKPQPKTKKFLTRLAKRSQR